ncbi:MAG TPA: Uma2 family endonuclease [Urbifossiella sp.]|nr:Uma2 family endonuclease [Urbifossiella sp.]
MTTAAPPRPAAVPAAPLFTPEELLQMPDGGKGYELIDGQLKEKVVSFRSSHVGACVVWVLESYRRTVAPGWVCGSDNGFRCFAAHPGRVRKPDAAFFAYPRMTEEQYADEGFTLIAPDLVAEVVSPSNSAEEVDEKAKDWIQAGVQEVWVLHPKTRHLYVFRAGGGYAFLREADTLTSPVLPGFSVPVADLFRVPAPPPQAPAAGGE